MSDRFEKLPVWQKSHELTLLIMKEVAPQLPGGESSDLAGEIMRASMTVGATLAGASGHFYTRERVRGCYEARGLLYETLNYVLLIDDLHYLPNALQQRVRGLTDEAIVLLNDFIASLRKKGSTD
jgi:four helix bundle protein